MAQNTHVNKKLISLWKDLGNRKKTFIQAFPEIKEEISNLYWDGYSSCRLEEITGISAATVLHWASGRKVGVTLAKMKKSPKYIQIKSEMMHEISQIKHTHRMKLKAGNYQEDYNPQEHDLKDEWEISKP